MIDKVICSFQLPLQYPVKSVDQTPAHLCKEGIMTGMVFEENLQVIRCWLVAEWGKPQGNMSSVEIEEFMLEVENKVLKIPAPELVEKVNTLVQDPVKLCRLLAWRWDHREIYMKDFGPWRTVGDALPLEACKHSIVEAVEFIRNNPQKLPQHLEKWNGSGSNSRYIQCVVKLQSISNIAAFIRSRDLLSILVAESEQRGRECCDLRRYSSEEGSHRAIALALTGYETISAWVGNPFREVNRRGLNSDPISEKGMRFCFMDTSKHFYRRFLWQ